MTRMNVLTEDKHIIRPEENWVTSGTIQYGGETEDRVSMYKGTRK
jgi:hypothetical protein